MTRSQMLRALGVLAAVCALFALALFATGCVKNYPPLPGDGTSSSSPTPVAASHTIEFRVLGNVSLTDITYGSAQFGTTMTETTLPWSASFTTDRPTLFVYLKAESSFNGHITAQIFVDGELFREATNNFSGSLNVADASGTVELPQ